jgi:hypothetical protein
MFAGSLDFTGDHAVNVVSSTGLVSGIREFGTMAIDSVHNYLYVTAAILGSSSGIVLKVPVTAIPTGLPQFFSRSPVYLRIDYPRVVSNGEMFSINATLEINRHDEQASVFLNGNDVIMFFYNPYAYPVRDQNCQPNSPDGRKLDVYAGCSVSLNGNSGDEHLVFFMNAPATPTNLSFNVSARVVTDIGYGLSQTYDIFQMVSIFVGNFLEQYAVPIVFGSGITLGGITVMYFAVIRSRWRPRRSSKSGSTKFCTSCGHELFAASRFCDRCGSTQ